MNKDIKENGKYAIYLRKSRADMEAELRGEGETLARHENLLLELARNKNIVIEEIYKEIVSGESIDSRPEMQRLLSDVKQFKWNGILVVEVERLARGETMDQGIVANAFKISNTKIITPTKTYDPQNEFDEEYFEFGLFMSRREYKTINRRLQRGRMISAKEGKYVGSVAPFGYSRVKIKDDKGYTLNENSEAKIVKLIFNLYVYEDLSICGIAKKLNNMNFKTRKSKEWTPSTINDILCNPVYIGKIKWNCRKEIRIYKNGVLRRTRPRSNKYLIIDGLHKPIINNKTWEGALKKRNLNYRKKNKNNTIKNPLYNILICGKCGKKMKRRSYSKYSKEPTIYCNNPKCDNVGSKFCYIEEKVVEGMSKWLENYSLNYSECLKRLEYNKIEHINELIILLEKDIKHEKDKLQNVFEYLEDGTYSKEMFNMRKNIILQNIDKMNNSVDEYKEKLNEIQKESKVNTTKIFNNFLDMYNFLKNPEEKNNLLQIVLDRVLYKKEEKSIKKTSDPTNFSIILYPKIDKII